MKVTQVAQLLNDTVKEDLGLESVINEDLSNVVDFGHKVFDMSEANLDNFCKALIARIGRTIFVNRKYDGNTLGLYRDSFEYGAVLQKITLDELFERSDIISLHCPLTEDTYHLIDEKTIERYQARRSGEVKLPRCESEKHGSHGL